jgi:hypothetical protein
MSSLKDTKAKYVEKHSTWPYLDDEVALLFFRAGQEEMRTEAANQVHPSLTATIERIMALPLEGDDDRPD